MGRIQKAIVCRVNPHYVSPCFIKKRSVNIISQKMISFNLVHFIERCNYKPTLTVVWCCQQSVESVFAAYGQYVSVLHSAHEHRVLCDNAYVCACVGVSVWVCVRVCTWVWV